MRAHTTNKTNQSTENSLDKSIEFGEKPEIKNAKTEFADRILKQIQVSMGSSKRSVSVMSRTRKGEKKKMV